MRYLVTMTMREKLLKVYRVGRWVMLLVLVAALFLGSRKPVPLALPQDPAARRLHVEALSQKLRQLEVESPAGTASEVRLNSEEVSAALTQAAGNLPAGEPPEAAQLLATQPQVRFEGDIVRGQLPAQVGGRTVYVTVAGRLGAREGYATFEPTEFKVGDLTVPVSLVNEPLQKRLAEERDKLKLPEFVGDLRIENGELVIAPKR